MGVRARGADQVRQQERRAVHRERRAHRGDAGEPPRGVHQALCAVPLVRNPETVINISKRETIHLKCKACGAVSDVDMRHKLCTFIIKNPPEKDKNGSKKDEQLRRAEKEREEEGAALDAAAAEERKKKKAEKKEKKEK